MVYILYKELSYALMGLCFKTHKTLGRFRSEKTYTDYFERLLINNKIDFQREKPMPASFEGEFARRNIPDFVIENKIVLDFKAKQTVTKEDYIQIKRYPSASNLKLGIIVNFRQPYLYSKRVAN